VSQTVYRPVRPGTNGVIAKVSDPGRAITGVCAPNPTGQGPLVLSVGDLPFVGTTETYGWPRGVTSLPEQARVHNTSTATNTCFTHLHQLRFCHPGRWAWIWNKFYGNKNGDVINFMGMGQNKFLRRWNKFYGDWTE